MPFNGQGVFGRVYQWVNDASNNIFVDATRTDQDSNDIADGLTNCITRDGQSTVLANLPMGGNKLTGLGTGQNAGDSVNYGQVFNNPGYANGLTVTGGVVSMAGAASVTVPTVALNDDSNNSASTAYVNQKAFQAALPAQPGTAIPQFLRTLNGVASWAALAMLSATRTANTQLVAADSSTYIRLNGAVPFTQTFALPAALTNGWYVYLANIGQDVEVAAPAAITTTSSTSNSISAGTTWTVGTGLAIAAGNLVNVRNTNDPFNQRITGTVASYNSATGALVVNAQVRIGSGTYASWTITTCGANAGIDGLSSYVMYPGEIRVFRSNGTGLDTTLLSAFRRVFLASEIFVKPPGYTSFGVVAHGGGGGGGSGYQITGGSSSTLYGGAPGAQGGYSVLEVPASGVLTSEIVTVGAGGSGGAAVSIAGGGNAGSAGGDSNFGGWVRARGGTAGSGGNAGAGPTSGVPGIGVPTGYTAAFGATSLIGGASGAGGGLITASTPAAGGVGSAVSYGSTTTIAGGTAGATGTAGGNGGAGLPLMGIGGSGAGGGGASTTGASGFGGSAAANSGAGGGGGGASSNALNSGAGGDGGSGFLLLTGRA